MRNMQSSAMQTITSLSLDRLCRIDESKYALNQDNIPIVAGMVGSFYWQSLFVIRIGISNNIRCLR